MFYKSSFYIYSLYTRTVVRRPHSEGYLFDSRSLLAVAVGVAVGAVGLALSREVLEASLRIGLHTLAAVHPSGGADLTMLVGELESLNKTDSLLDIAADGQVVDGDLAEDTLGVDDEETAESDTLLLD